jgi:hypothetical protein
MIDVYMTIAVFIRVEACRRNVDTAAKQTAFLARIGEPA